jgi:hypothetical protein
MIQSMVVLLYSLFTCNGIKAREFGLLLSEVHLIVSLLHSLLLVYNQANGISSDIVQTMISVGEPIQTQLASKQLPFQRKYLPSLRP